VKEKGHAVIVVAEGAGEDILGMSAETDSGGNRKLPKIGEFMKQKVNDYFQKHGREPTGFI
jgi:6-phosphofructokinase 1